MGAVPLAVQTPLIEVTPVADPLVAGTTALSLAGAGTVVALRRRRATRGVLTRLVRPCLDPAGRTTMKGATIRRVRNRR